MREETAAKKPGLPAAARGRPFYQELRARLADEVRAVSAVERELTNRLHRVRLSLESLCAAEAALADLCEQLTGDE